LKSVADNPLLSFLPVFLRSIFIKAVQIVRTQLSCMKFSCVSVDKADLAEKHYTMMLLNIPFDCAQGTCAEQHSEQSRRAVPELAKGCSFNKLS
jgi:hypothetical protein